MSSHRKKILVLRYRFIGDTVLTVPFLRNLRSAEPDAFIAWVVAPGSSDVVRGIPYVDELIYWDPVTIHADSRGGHNTLSKKIGFIRDLRRRGFDKAYVLKRSLSSAIMAWLSGASERIGFSTEGRGFLLTGRVAYQHDTHEVENFLNVLRADGVAVRDDYLELWTDAAEDAHAIDRFREAGGNPDSRFLMIHPFSAVVQRSWPLENYAELAGRFTERGDLLPVIVGGPGDRTTYDLKKHLFPAKTIDLIGKITLRETVALLRRASLFVGNDSGIMHLAAAAGAPIVAIFGPQTPVKFGPWTRNATVLYRAMPCSPCRQKFFTECKPSAHQRPACIESFTVEEVFAQCTQREASSRAV